MMLAKSDEKWTVRYPRRTHRKMIFIAWKHLFEDDNKPSLIDLLHYWFMECKYNITLSDILYVYNELLEAGFYYYDWKRKDV